MKLFNCLLLFMLLSNKPSTIWLKLEIGIIGPATLEMVDRALQEVAINGYQGLVVQLDTPGGELQTTRQVVQQILGASQPVIVWVGPSGAHAGSAGSFITLAATVAAMADGTNIGAARPVQASGKNVEQSAGGEKIINDTIAFIESIAMARGRNVEMARSFVISSISITADEAYQHRVIDVIANDLSTLLEQLDGRTFNQNGVEVEIVGQGATIVDYQPSLRQLALELLGDPNLFYLLFLAGLIGLGFELVHPGGLFPGIFGGICLLLALIATAVLPVSFGAASLIFVGIALLTTEMFVPSFGILGIGGLVAITLGSVFLVDPDNLHGLRVSWYTIVPGVVVAGGLSLAIGYLVTKTYPSDKPSSGIETLIGQQAKVVDGFGDRELGRVRVQGEVWQAQAQPPYPITGDTVKILARNDLLLTVARLESVSTEQQS